MCITNIFRYSLGKKAFISCHQLYFFNLTCFSQSLTLMPLILQVQLPNLSFWIQETFQVCCLIIGFCENVLKISSLLVAFPCKHFKIWILIENFHPYIISLKSIHGHCMQKNLNIAHQRCDYKMRNIPLALLYQKTKHLKASKYLISTMTPLGFSDSFPEVLQFSF